MNIMIAAAGMESGLAGVGGTTEGILFIAVFATIGLALFYVAGRMTRRAGDEGAVVRYTIPRL
ncbi:MAG: hypothetical protein KGJ84_03080 [Elusimicrobia bacterium]|nr:hypothetical protein [Elusimicrobiota bacterium]